MLSNTSYAKEKTSRLGEQRPVGPLGSSAGPARRGICRGQLGRPPVARAQHQSAGRPSSLPAGDTFAGSPAAACCSSPSSRLARCFEARRGPLADLCLARVSPAEASRAPAPTPRKAELRLRGPAGWGRGWAAEPARHLSIGLGLPAGRVPKGQSERFVNLKREPGRDQRHHLSRPTRLTCLDRHLFHLSQLTAGRVQPKAARKQQQTRLLIMPTFAQPPDPRYPSDRPAARTPDNHLRH